MSAPRRALRLLTTRGVLRVAVCPLCGALVVFDGEQRHAAAHSADGERASGRKQR